MTDKYKQGDFVPCSFALSEEAQKEIFDAFDAALDVALKHGAGATVLLTVARDCNGSDVPLQTTGKEFIQAVNPELHSSLNMIITGALEDMTGEGSGSDLQLIRAVSDSCIRTQQFMRSTLPENEDDRPRFK